MSNHKYVIEKTIEFAESKNYQGFDPYDIKAHPFLIPLQRHKFTKFGFEILASNFPVLLRKLFRIQPAENNKGLALFIRAFVRLYEKSSDEKFLSEANKLFERLLANRSPNYNNLCWGYPFAWQTAEELYPPNFPNIATTIQGGLAILALWKATRFQEGPELLKSVCRFITDDLLRSQRDAHLFLSYSPADHYQVLNTNAQILGFLYQVKKAIGDAGNIDLTHSLAQTIIANQATDGSWPYRVDEENSFIDNYHSAILIENLQVVRESFPDLEIEKAISKGLSFFKKNLLLDDEIPLLRTDMRVPIDIHSCAHSIILLKKTNDPAWRRILTWTLENMYHEGRFFYRVYRIPRLQGMSRKERLMTLSVLRSRDESCYMRWGQAWMLLALSEAYEQ